MALQDIESSSCFLPAGHGTLSHLLSKLRKALQGVSADAGKLVERGYAIELTEKDLPFAGYLIRATDNRRLNTHRKRQRPRRENQEIQQMIKQMLNPPENQPDIGLGDIIQALTSPDRARQLKLLLGRQFSDIETQMSGFGGTVLLTERNKACFKVLDQQIADGKRNLGVFYGAGHMSEMEKMLLSRGFHKADVQWRVAWNLSEGADAKEDQKPAPKTKDPQTRNSNGIIRIEYVH
jgi:hypothetical protein